MVVERSLITQVADCRSPFEEVVFVCWNLGGFRNDCFRLAAYESAVLLRTWNISGDDEERGWESKAIHDGNSNTELIDCAIIVGKRHCSALAILPRGDFRSSDLAEREA